MATLNEKQAALFTDRNWGVIATIREDGSPHATPVWIDYDGENVLVNSAYGRTKVKNIERDPRATVTVLPAADQQGGYVMVSGTAEIVEEGALEHINMLAKKYLGEDKYPYLGPGERRVIIRVHPERADLFLVGGGQLRQRKSNRPHGALVQLRAVVEAEHRVPLLELARVAEEADDLAVLGIGGHPVPRFRREVWGGGLDELMEPPSDGAVLRRHRGDRGAHGAFPIRLVLQLSGARFHRGLFLARESFLLVGALGLPLAFLHSGAHRAPFVRSTTCAKRSSRCSHVLMPSKA